MSKKNTQDRDYVHDNRSVEALRAAGDAPGACLRHDAFAGPVQRAIIYPLKRSASQGLQLLRSLGAIY